MLKPVTFNIFNPSGQYINTLEFQQLLIDFNENV